MKEGLIYYRLEHRNIFEHVTVQKFHHLDILFRINILQSVGDKMFPCTQITWTLINHLLIQTSVGLTLFLERKSQEQRGNRHLTDYINQVPPSLRLGGTWQSLIFAHFYAGQMIRFTDYPFRDNTVLNRYPLHLLQCGIYNPSIHYHLLLCRQRYLHHYSY